MEAWVSAKRVNKFLQLSELDLYDYYHRSGATTPTSGKRGVTVAVRDGHFTWGSGRCGEEGGGEREGGDGGRREGEDWRLRDVNLSIKPVSLCVCVFVCIFT